MTITGWIIMIVSVGSMTWLFAWCLYRVLTSPPSSKLHGIEDIQINDDKE